VRSGVQFTKEPPGGSGGLVGEFAGRKTTDFGQLCPNHRNIGGFGEGFAVFISQMGILAFGKRRGEVGGIGFDQKTAFLDYFGDFDDFFGVFSGQSAPKREKNVFLDEGFDGVAGPGVGVEQEPSGMGRLGEQYFEHAGPGIAAMEAGGQGELNRKIELGAEDGFAFGIESVAHAGVEADFADAGGPAGELFAEARQPTGAEALDKPGVDAVGAQDLGVGLDEVGDGGPVGFAGGIDMEVLNPCGAGAGENLRQVGSQARILQMIVGVEPREIFRVRRGGGCYAHS